MVEAPFPIDVDEYHQQQCDQANDCAQECGRLHRNCECETEDGCERFELTFHQRVGHNVRLLPKTFVLTECLLRKLQGPHTGYHLRQDLRQINGSEIPVNHPVPSLSWSQ